EGQGRIDQKPGGNSGRPPGTSGSNRCLSHRKMKRQLSALLRGNRKPISVGREGEILVDSGVNGRWFRSEWTTVASGMSGIRDHRQTQVPNTRVCGRADS